MRVYDRSLTGASTESNRAQEAQKTEAGGSGATERTGSGGSGDQVQLSGMLGRLSKALSSQGAERSARVAALASEYCSGSYQPDAAGTSRGLIGEALSPAGGQ